MDQLLWMERWKQVRLKTDVWLNTYIFEIVFVLGPTPVLFCFHRRRYRECERHLRVGLHTCAGCEDIPVHSYWLYGGPWTLPWLPLTLWPRWPQHQPSDFCGHSRQGTHHCQWKRKLQLAIKPREWNYRWWWQFERLQRPISPPQPFRGGGFQRLSQRRDVGIFDRYPARAHYCPHGEGWQRIWLHNSRQPVWGRPASEADSGLPTMQRSEGGRHHRGG